MTPLPGKSGEKVLVLGQFHLQTPFVGASSFGEDVQDERNAVDDLYLEGFLQVLLLIRRKLVIENNDIVIVGAL